MNKYILYILYVMGALILIYMIVYGVNSLGNRPTSREDLPGGNTTIVE